MEPVRRLKLGEQVKTFIRQQIMEGKYANGDRIESIRSLSKKLNVSHVTVEKAVRQLAEEGLLVSRFGDGTRVASNLPYRFTQNYSRKRKKNLYFFFDSEQGRQISYFQDHVLHILRDECQKRDWELKIDFASGENHREADADPAAIAIIQNSNPFQPYPDLAIPVILFGVEDDCRHTAVLPDNYRAGWDAGTKYCRAGCYKQAFFITGKRTLCREYNNLLHFEDRWRGISDALDKQAGLVLPSPLQWEIHINLQAEVKAVFEKICKRKELAPTMLFIANRTMAEEISILAISMGLRIPEDISILSFVRRNSGCRQLKIDTYDFNHADMGNTVVRLLDDAVEGRKLPSRILLPMELNMEGSCADDPV